MGILRPLMELLVLLCLLSGSLAWHSAPPLKRPGLTTRKIATSTLASRASSRAYWEEDWAADDRSYDDYTSTAGRNAVKEQEALEWETCNTPDGTAHVLLPPQSATLPTCVIHFVGGTFFGSAPNVWYRRLLEDAVRHTQCAVVATSIPPTFLQSPLEHVQLSRKVHRQFQTAWQDVLLDEYGDDIKSMPVCGIGHSLGSRLLVVLSTLSSAPLRPYLPPPYKSFVLISFNNFNAAAGIPGLEQLRSASRRMERYGKNIGCSSRSLLLSPHRL